MFVGAGSPTSELRRDILNKPAPTWKRTNPSRLTAGGPQLPALYAQTFSIILSLTQILTIASGFGKNFSGSNPLQSTGTRRAFLKDAGDELLHPLVVSSLPENLLA